MKIREIINTVLQMNEVRYRYPSRNAWAREQATKRSLEYSTRNRIRPQDDPNSPEFMGDYDDTVAGEAEKMRNAHAKQYGYGNYSPEALRVQASQQARKSSIKITAKYSGRCSNCPDPITAGMQVNFDPSTKKVSHVACKK